MRKALWKVTVPVLALWGWEAALAQGLDDCSVVCSLQTACNAACMLDDDPFTEMDDTWTTCGQYGVCDIDIDDDLVYSNDNCPNTYNPGQGDCDGDSIGDACDSQNAIWQPADAPYTCYISSLTLNTTTEVTRVTEQLLIDVSNCYGTSYGGLGIAWLRWEARGSCPWVSNSWGIGPDDRDCCEHWFGYSECQSHFGNNTCATN